MRYRLTLTLPALLLALTACGEPAADPYAHDTGADCRRIERGYDETPADARILAQSWIRSVHGPEAITNEGLISRCIAFMAQEAPPRPATGLAAVFGPKCTAAMAEQQRAVGALDPSGKDRASVQRLAEANAHVLEVC